MCCWGGRSVAYVCCYPLCLTVVSVAFAIVHVSHSNLALQNLTAAQTAKASIK